MICKNCGYEIKIDTQTMVDKKFITVDIDISHAHTSLFSTNEGLRLICTECGCEEADIEAV